MFKNKQHLLQNHQFLKGHPTHPCFSKPKGTPTLRCHPVQNDLDGVVRERRKNDAMGVSGCRMYPEFLPDPGHMCCLFHPFKIAWNQPSSNCHQCFPTLQSGRRVGPSRFRSVWGRKREGVAGVAREQYTSRLIPYRSYGPHLTGSGHAKTSTSVQDQV